MRLLHSLVSSIFLYACETWKIKKELQRRTTAIDFKCLRLLKISYKDRITNKEVRNRVFMIIVNHKDLLTKVKERKLRWYYHIIRDDYSMSKILKILKWSDNIHE